MKMSYTISINIQYQQNTSPNNAPISRTKQLIRSSAYTSTAGSPYSQQATLSIYDLLIIDNLNDYSHTLETCCHFHVNSWMLLLIYVGIILLWKVGWRGWPLVRGVITVWSCLELFSRQVLLAWRCRMRGGEGRGFRRGVMWLLCYWWGCFGYILIDIVVMHLRSPWLPFAASSTHPPGLLPLTPTTPDHTNKTNKPNKTPPLSQTFLSPPHPLPISSHQPNSNYYVFYKNLLDPIFINLHNHNIHQILKLIHKCDLYDHFVKNIMYT